MINETLFKERMSYLELNFNVEFDSKYLKFIYQSTRDKFDDDDVNYGFKELFKKTSDEWNRIYGYGGRPSLADWIGFFRIKKDAEKQRIENERLRKIRIQIIKKDIEKNPHLRGKYNEIEGVNLNIQ